MKNMNAEDDDNHNQASSRSHSDKLLRTNVNAMQSPNTETEHSHAGIDMRQDGQRMNSFSHK